MRRLTWLAVSLGIAIGSPVHAQPRRPADTAPSAASADPAGEPADVVDRREKLKKRIRAMRNAKLMEELSIDGQTSGRLVSVFDRFDEEFYKLLAKRIEIQRKLHRADSMKDPRAIDRLIDEAIANQRALWDLDEHRVSDLRKILTPAQVAKLLVVLPEFERKIQNQLRNAINQRRGGPGGAGGAGRAKADPDDDVEPDEVEPPRPARSQPRRREAPLPPRSTPSNAPGNTPPCDPNQPCR